MSSYYSNSTTSSHPGRSVCVVVFSCMCQPLCWGHEWCREWNCCKMEATDSPPPAKQTRRFASPKEKATMVDICKGFTPANTDKCTKWAVGVFSS